MSDNIRRTRGVSHKKHKTTSAMIKIENAAIAKRKRTSKSPPKATPSRIVGVVDEASQLSGVSTIAAHTIGSPPSRRKKSGSYYKVSNNRLNMSFRGDLSPCDKLANMLPYMSKEINSNFNIIYKRRSTFKRRSNRIQSTVVSNENSNGALVIDPNPSSTDITQSTDPSYSSDNNTLQSNSINMNNYRRCYVEDFMVREVGESIVVLVPLSYKVDTTGKWRHLFQSDINYTDVTFNKIEYGCYNCEVATNPMYDNVIGGMQLSDFQLGFGTHNYGCHLEFSRESTASLGVLVTWDEVMNGKKNGIQIWHGGEDYRDVYTNFADRSKTTQGLNSLMNSLYSEVYGDRLQCLHLLLSYHRANNKNQAVTIRKYDSLAQNFGPAVLEGESYNLLLSDLNNSFGVCIQKSYGDFVVIGRPVITRTETDVLVALYKSKMPYHYKTMYAMLGYNKKVGITKNKHLVETGYYDRQVFYSFLSMSRQRNPHKMMNWAIISACANYGRGCGDMVNRRSTYLGGSATTQSFLRYVKPHLGQQPKRPPEKIPTVWKFK